MICKLIPSAPRLILFAGHAGTGKSTIAKKALPLIIEKTGEDFFFLDKDTAYGAYSAHVMERTLMTEIAPTIFRTCVIGNIKG